MKAPSFWQAGQGGATAALLTPVSWLYAFGAAVKNTLGPSPWPVSVPVICVGNVTAGGSGKTPVTMDIARRLSARNIQTHILTRGYGGSLAGPVQADPAQHSAAEVGDEALLLARCAPTWVGADRTASALMAIGTDAQALVMDDGFQNQQLAKDLSILVFDGGFGIGNGRRLPAGPLRETLTAAAARAQAAVCIGEDRSGLWPSIPDHLTKLRARVVATEMPEAMQGQSALAFAGIGRPDKFFATLAEAGVQIAGTQPFPDHHPYSQAELDALRRRAAELGAGLVTTEKDLMRIPADQRAGIEALTVTLKWEDEGALDALLQPLFDKDDHAR